MGRLSYYRNMRNVYMPLFQIWVSVIFFLLVLLAGYVVVVLLLCLAAIRIVREIRYQNSDDLAGLPTHQFRSGFIDCNSTVNQVWSPIQFHTVKDCVSGLGTSAPKSTHH